jgi:hypothetical protein
VWESVPDGGYQILAGPGRVLVTPGRDLGARPGQICGIVLMERHLLPNAAYPICASVVSR